MTSPAKILKISILSIAMIINGMSCFANDCVEIKRNKSKKIFTYKQKNKLKMKVLVSCYNPHDPKQTGSIKTITSSGYKIKPNDKVIAVSHDLLKKGFKINSSVKIENLDGIYRIKDTMPKHRRNSIDISIFEPSISLKENKKKAIEFGVKRLYISKIANYSKTENL
jgi:3D (Asp-Asp-Asp) domain-containing protein